jgi:hypothetical protein
MKATEPMKVLYAAPARLGTGNGLIAKKSGGGAPDYSGDRNATPDNFWKVRVPMLYNCPNFSSQNSRGTGRWQTQGRRGGAMRESLGNEIPDTAPYTEWLAIVGSIVVAVLVCAVLFSNGILT